mmetsp:Transcript_13418/g.37688  ORF Transcript_13418/g.37688 Transcript_13418/m.37688 type:complete len:340 (-) Transcript_13418:228-1247(-)
MESFVLLVAFFEPDPILKSKYEFLEGDATAPVRVQLLKPPSPDSGRDAAFRRLAPDGGVKPFHDLVLEDSAVAILVEEEEGIHNEVDRSFHLFIQGDAPCLARSAQVQSVGIQLDVVHEVQKRHDHDELLEVDQVVLVPVSLSPDLQLVVLWDVHRETVLGHGSAPLTEVDVPAAVRVHAVKHAPHHLEPFLDRWKLHEDGVQVLHPRTARVLCLGLHPLLELLDEQALEVADHFVLVEDNALPIRPGRAVGAEIFAPQVVLLLHLLQLALVFLLLVPPPHAGPLALFGVLHVSRHLLRPVNVHVSMGRVHLPCSIGLHERGAAWLLFALAPASLNRFA